MDFTIFRYDQIEFWWELRHASEIAAVKIAEFAQYSLAPFCESNVIQIAQQLPNTIP